MLIRGDARAVPLVDGCVDCVVTSPPYFGLRDYGASGQIGLEPTPDRYVASLVAVFRDVRRVLKDVGTCWVNLGDSYASPPAGNKTPSGFSQVGGKRDGKLSEYNTQAKQWGIAKQKDLLGIPWRVAFALQVDGWVLRQEIIWQKPNPMPESVQDRCTKAHEQLFMFAKARWSGPVSDRFAAISDEDARWLALFLDTEGNIVIKRARSAASGRLWYGAQMVFSGSCRALLETAQVIIGKGTIHERPGTNAPMFYLQLANQDARWLLYRLYPYLIVKQRQARLAIYVQHMLSKSGQKRPHGFRSDEHSAALELAWQTMKSLNHFGSPDVSWAPEPKRGRWVDCERYFYDASAIAEPVSVAMLQEMEQGYDGLGLKDYKAAGVQNPSSVKARIIERARVKVGAARDDGQQPHSFHLGKGYAANLSRNRRSVWTVPTMPYSGAHFATMPEKLVEPCILAGCPLGGLVLDPFVGSGTVVSVAQRLGRRGVGVDLSYHDLSKERTAQRGLIFGEATA